MQYNIWRNISVPPHMYKKVWQVCYPGYCRPGYFAWAFETIRGACSLAKEWCYIDKHCQKHQFHYAHLSLCQTHCHPCNSTTRERTTTMKTHQPTCPCTYCDCICIPSLPEATQYDHFRHASKKVPLLGQHAPREGDTASYEEQQRRDSNATK